MKIAHVAAFAKAGNASNILSPDAVKRMIQKRSTKQIEWVDIEARDTPDNTTIELINGCALLIIGGGGLFLPDATYNEVSGWQWPVSVKQINDIQVPIYLRSVGFNLFRDQRDFNENFNASIQALACKCNYIGLRDSGSIYAIRKYLPYDLHSKIILDPCPTTIANKLYPEPPANPNSGQYKIGVNIAFDREKLRYGNRAEKLCADIAEGIKRAEIRNKIRLNIEYFSHLNIDDKGHEILKTYIPWIKYRSLGKMNCKEIIGIYKSANLTISTRGQAQLISFGCTNPILSIVSHNKLQWFLDDIKRPEWGLDSSNIDWGAEEIEQSVTNSIANNHHIREDIREMQENIYKLLEKNNSLMLDQKFYE